jgi:hypothetical protein
VAVHPAADETIEEAFEREHADRSLRGLWFDLGISDAEATWIIPRYGGRHTEQMLDGLAAVASSHTAMKWARSDGVLAGDE